jgi:hypothetical protein
MERSIGHLAFIGPFEYFIRHGEIYRAPAANPLDINGIRQGARFECPASQWERLAVLIGR